MPSLSIADTLFQQGSFHNDMLTAVSLPVTPSGSLNLQASTIRNARISSVLSHSQCQSGAYFHRRKGGIKVIIRADLVGDHLELCFHYHYMRLDFSAPQCAPTKSMEGSLE